MEWSVCSNCCSKVDFPLKKRVTYQGINSQGNHYTSYSDGSYAYINYDEEGQVINEVFVDKDKNMFVEPSKKSVRKGQRSFYQTFDGERYYVSAQDVERYKKNLKSQWTRWISTYFEARRSRAHTKRKYEILYGSVEVTYLNVEKIVLVSVVDLTLQRKAFGLRGSHKKATQLRNLRWVC